ncbi:DUF1759 domain-containing protein, partial [Streptococcus dysgalactiae]|uniref:DUF1759 domain-containing protein n=1 Tax=Streptococcus dysgalactiae TaxID=1334 RepID=UPI00194EFD59
TWSTFVSVPLFVHYNSLFYLRIRIANAMESSEDESLMPVLRRESTHYLGKSNSVVSLCQRSDVKTSEEIKLELESAALEIQMAEAMQRAADTKRRAAAAIRRAHIETIAHDNETNQSTVAEHVSTPPNLSNEAKARRDNVVHSVGGTSEVIPKNIELLERLMSRMDLPRCELPYFDGSPTQYLLFFRQFDEQIQNRIKDNGQRLTYLYNYCTGKAKEAIKGCLLYPASEGYSRARRILCELFGQKHSIVRSILDEVTTPGLISMDAESISSFSNQLMNCVDTLEQLGYVADLNAITTIEKILAKLPRYVTVDWVKKNRGNISRRSRAQFSRSM